MLFLFLSKPLITSTFAVLHAAVPFGGTDADAERSKGADGKPARSDELT